MTIRWAFGWVVAVLLALSTASAAEPPTLEWVHEVQGVRTLPHAGIRSYGQTSAVTVDWFRNVYVSGTFVGAVVFTHNENLVLLTSPGWSQYESIGTPRMFVGRLSSNGDADWLFALPSEWDSSATGIAVDSNGHVYASGIFQGVLSLGPPHGEPQGKFTGNERGVVVKLASHGEVLWHRTIPATHESKALAIAIGEEAVHAAGTFEGEFGADPSRDGRPVRGEKGMFIQTWDTDGNEVWTRTMSSRRTSNLGSMAVDSHGDTYITGLYRGPMDFDPEGDSFVLNGEGGFVAKYSSSGEFLWARRIGDNTGGKSIAVSSESGVFVTGRMWEGPIAFETTLAPFVLEGAGRSDIFILHLSNNGHFRWVRRIGGKNDDISGGVIVDSDGNAYVHGVVQSHPTADQGQQPISFENRADFIAKMNPDGEFLWTLTRDLSGFPDSPHTLAMDKDGNLYTIGEIYNRPVDLDPHGRSTIVTPRGKNMAYIAKYAAPRPPGISTDSIHLHPLPGFAIPGRLLPPTH